MARLRPDLSLVPLLATLALACQDSTAPDAPLPLSEEAVPEEATPERPEPAALVDQTHWADGYVWADNPTAAAYTPDPYYAFNRTGGAIRITKPAGTTGRYLVKFSGLSAFLGSKSTVHVTSYFTDGTYCKPVKGYLVADSLEVRCFRAATGAAVNTYFTVLVLRQAGKLAFAHAHRPTEPSYTPQARGSWNPGGAIRVVRNNVGDYQVIFYNIRTLLAGSGNLGHVQVSAVGPGKHHCKVRTWNLGDESPNDGVNVLCHTQAGTRADTKFNVLFLAPSDRLAYVWANQPSAASYTPSTVTSTGGATSIQRLGTGHYIVTWAGIASQLLDGGNVQVTAFGFDNPQCNVSGWGNFSATVRCFAPTGAPVDATYTVLLGS